MPFKVDNTEITKLYIDDKECKVLYINGKPYFGKQYTIYDNASGNVNFTIARADSPYQHASGKALEIGSHVYEGDRLAIIVAAAKDYYNPKLYVDIGDGQGELLRQYPFLFTVCGDVTVRGTAESATLYTNKKSTIFNGSGSLTVPGMENAGGILVTAMATFMEKVGEEGGKTTTDYATVSVFEKALPCDLEDNKASVHLSRDGDKLLYDFRPYKGMVKGVGTDITPFELNIMVVKVRT